MNKFMWGSGISKRIFQFLDRALSTLVSTYLKIENRADEYVAH